MSYELRLDPGKDDKSFNLLNLSAEQVERILASLTESERQALGQDTSSAMALSLASKLLTEQRKTAQVKQAFQAPEGTTPPPPNG